MSRSRPSKATLLTFALIIVAVGCFDRRMPASHAVDNVILISIDSLRPDHLGIYGHDAPTSPTIDALGSTGLVFSRAHSTTSWTLPSHMALLTGLENDSHQVNDDGYKLSEEIETLAEVLQAADIHTAGFYSGPYLHSSFGFDQGFNSYTDCTSYAWTGAGKLPHDRSHRDVTNPIILEQIRKWLSSERPASRNFLFIHMWDVHYDYIAPRNYVELFDPDYTGAIDGTDFLFNPAIRKDMPKRDLRHLLARYDAEIRYTDDTVAQLLRMLGDKGLTDNSAVIVVSDHGEEFFEHKRKGHRLSLYEEVVRIPMIINVKRRQPPISVVRDVVSLVDLRPTVCELFRVPCRYNGPGESLMRYYNTTVTGQARNDALISLRSEKLGLDQHGIVHGQHKILRDNKASITKYFDLGDDPRERFPDRISIRGSSTAPAPASTTSDRLERRLSLARKEAVRLYGNERAPAVEMNERISEHLRSLGYIE